MRLERWLELMARDKKVAGGAIRFVLLEALGAPCVRARRRRDATLRAVLDADSAHASETKTAPEGAVFVARDVPATVTMQVIVTVCRSAACIDRRR